MELLMTGASAGHCIAGPAQIAALRVEQQNCRRYDRVI